MATSRKLAALSLVLASLSLVIFALAGSSLAQEQKMAPVDLELVLAVDVSQSMDYEEHSLQRMGYVEAFRHKDVINAILSGPQGRIAVTVMEWGGFREPIDLIPWTILDSEAAVKRFADRLADEPINSEQRTSISWALYAAAEKIEENAIASHRQVIDVSGDGANNTGPPVEQARDAVLKRGIVINGLPILLNKPMQYYDIPNLDRYYKQCVIGGPAAFIAPVFNLNQLAGTIRKKLVLEISGLDAAPGTAPVQYADAEANLQLDEPGLLRVQLKLPTARTDCFAGEKAVGRGGFGGFDQ